MKVIVAVDNKWAIGKNNDLLFNIPADMAHFREHTMNKCVIMGSNTLKSFPGGRPLKNRKNIVLFPGGDKRDDYTVVETLDELFKEIENVNTDDVYVIGGAMFYHTLLPYCDAAYITKIDADGHGTVFFDNLDELDNWELVESGVTQTYDNIDFKFCTYKNNRVEKYKCK